MLGRIGTPAKGANLQGNSLGNQLRRKDILSPFRMFYSLGRACMDDFSGKMLSG
jgi:hypothetical protein